MKLTLLAALVATLAACSAPHSDESDIEEKEAQIEAFFGSLESSTARPVALKKNSIGVTSYLLTVHGYGDNLGVCNELIAMHQASGKGSVIEGDYYCQPIPLK